MFNRLWCNGPALRNIRETHKKHMNSAPNLLFLELPSIRAWLQYSNYNYYSIFFWGKGQQSPQSPFLHSSVPPFLPTCDVGRLQRALSLGYPRSSVQQHSAYSQDVSEKSPANTLLIFSTKMDSAPLHLSNCGSLTACNILSWPTGRQKNTPAFFMIQYTALKGR